MFKTFKHYPLQLFLSEFRHLEENLSSFKSLISGLGDNAEIISDALHLSIQEGNFGCFEDGITAILLALLLDAQGQNYLHEEYDALRNGAALEYLLQDLVIEDPPAPVEAVPDREVAE